MTRALAAIVLIAGCYSDLRVGGTAPVGPGHGNAGIDLGIGLGAEGRSERIRTGGGLNLGFHGSDSPNGDSYVQLGPEGRIDVGLTEPNERGGRVMAVGWLSLGIGFDDEESESDGTPSSSGFFAQSFLGIGFGANKLRRPRTMVANSVAIGFLASRFSPGSGDGYWLLGVALSLSAGLDIDELVDVR